MKWRGILLGIMLVSLSVPSTYADQSISVSVSGQVPDTTITFIGNSSPNAFITYIEDGNVIGTGSANSFGDFNRLFTARTPGYHAYGIFAADSQSRTTPTYSFAISLLTRTDTIVSNILLPTTIDVTVSNNVNIFGEAAPTSTITILVSSEATQSTSSASDGNWNRYYSGLTPGHHTGFARVSRSGGLQSIDSNTVSFDVSCGYGNADLNADGRVDLTDFSILMYYWGSNHIPGDINCDGTIDLTDFSIMMYNWTG